MSETFQRKPIENGDLDTWAQYNDELNYNTIGLLSCRLYDSSGTLRLSDGRIGIDDGTNIGTVIDISDQSIDISAGSNSNWGKVEISVSGDTATIAISDISGATSADSLPSNFTDAYNGKKGGFYISSSKRCIGLYWKNASGTLEGVVNTIGMIDGYIGYCQSDDTDDKPYLFEKYKENKSSGSPNDSINTTTSISQLKDITYIDDSAVSSTDRIRIYVMEIGSWNMDTLTTKSVSLPAGITRDQIFNISVAIRSDDGTKIGYELVADNVALTLSTVNLSIIALRRVAGGAYDNGFEYADTNINRGWVSFMVSESNTLVP
jgi:hypothetical protein